MTSRKRSRVRAPGGETSTTVVGGSQGVELDMGTETVTMGVSATTTIDTGSETASMDFSGAPTVPLGTETVTMGASVVGSAVAPMGSETVSMGVSATVPMSTGSETVSMAATGVASVSDHTTTATAVTADTPAWTNPTNAQGAINGTEATHPGLSGVDNACDATLRCAGLVVPATPAGFTRTAVGIRIVHRWDLTITLPVAGVTDATHTIDLRDSADVLIANLNTRSAAGGGGTQATLLSEDYDISGLVSEAQLAAGVKIDCRAVCAYVPAVNGNTSWNVDAVHLRATYTISGIS